MPSFVPKQEQKASLPIREKMRKILKTVGLAGILGISISAEAQNLHSPDTLFVSSKNDARLKAYADSMAQYQFPARQLREKGKNFTFGPLLAEENLPDVQGKRENEVADWTPKQVEEYEKENEEFLKRTGIRHLYGNSVAYLEDKGRISSSSDLSLYKKSLSKDKVPALGFRPVILKGKPYSKDLANSFVAVYKKPVRPVMYRGESVSKIDPLIENISTHPEEVKLREREIPSFPNEKFFVRVHDFDPTLQNQKVPKVIPFGSEQERQEWIRKNAAHLQDISGGRGDFLDTDSIIKK